MCISVAGCEDLRKGKVPLRLSAPPLWAGEDECRTVYEIALQLQIVAGNSNVDLYTDNH